VAYCGATPHFVEVDPKTLGIDPIRLREHLGKITERKGDVCVNRQTGRPIRVVVPMHTFGHAVDLDALLEVAAEFDLVLVEDARSRWAPATSQSTPARSVVSRR